MTYFSEIGFKNNNNSNVISWGDNGYYLLTDNEGNAIDLPDNFVKKCHDYNVRVIEEAILNRDSESNIISCSKIGKITIYL